MILKKFTFVIKNQIRFLKITILLIGGKLSSRSDNKTSLQMITFIVDYIYNQTFAGQLIASVFYLHSAIVTIKHQTLISSFIRLNYQRTKLIEDTSLYQQTSLFNFIRSQSAQLKDGGVLLSIVRILWGEVFIRKSLSAWIRR